MLQGIHCTQLAFATHFKFTPDYKRSGNVFKIEKVDSDKLSQPQTVAYICEKYRN